MAQRENNIIIVITGSPKWGDQARDILHKAGYTTLTYAERGEYIAQLASDGAALILVDGADADWKSWAVIPTTSPATRRIPIFVVSDDDATRATALTYGAAGAITPAQLLDEVVSRIEQWARYPSPEAQTELTEQCAQPLPQPAQVAIERFNAGEYYDQHDIFEELWANDPRPIRDLYRTILQVGIAYYQITRGNWRGAHKMLLRNMQWMALLPNVCQGVNIAALREDSAAVRAELERVGEGGIAEFDMTLLKPIQYA